MIVVPTLNSHDLLPRLLTSLQHQTFSSWRLLFVDGASKREHRQWLRQCCIDEARCSWCIQDPAENGIFGAMNAGFLQANPDEWILFWGSDDWAAGPLVFSCLSSIVEGLAAQGLEPDLIVSRGRYCDLSTLTFLRSAFFCEPCDLDTRSFRRALFYGSTPPHQATLFGPGARRRLSRYSVSFRLSADLDYFLQLSHFHGLFVKCIDLDLVHMSDGGVSGKLTMVRLHEVVRAYSRSFFYTWFIPFILRYSKKIASSFVLG